MMTSRRSSASAAAAASVHSTTITTVDSNTIGNIHDTDKDDNGHIEVHESNASDKRQSPFRKFGLIGTLLEAVESLGFKEPTLIQQKVIKPIIKGHNV
jgi:hypothetical protein